MGFGRKIETRNHITGFREEIQFVVEQSKDAFFTWFSEAKDTDSAFVRGFWDFILHIASPISSFIKSPETITALEIGHGGGRILSAACKCFKKVIGIDIHENNDIVKKELYDRGVLNFELFKSDGHTIPIQGNSIDVVYSFIVLQHVEKIEIFEQYFKESYRILKPGGISVLYFGRKCFFSANRSHKILYQIDLLLEKVFVFKGYKEIRAKVNCTNLFVTVGYAKKLSKKIGYRIMQQIVSHKKVPDGIHLYGGQHGLILQKPR